MGKNALFRTAIAVALTLISIVAALPAPADASDRGRAKAIAFAKAQVGKPYVWGGTGPRGYDCSGLIYAAYRHAGRILPRTTYAQLAGLRRGGRLRAGDLVFSSRGHVALYIGNGRVISAPGRGRRIENQSAGYHLRYTKRSPY